MNAQTYNCAHAHAQQDHEQPVNAYCLCLYDTIIEWKSWLTNIKWRIIPYCRDQLNILFAFLVRLSLQPGFSPDKVNGTHYDAWLSTQVVFWSSLAGSTKNTCLNIIIFKCEIFVHYTYTLQYGYSFQWHFIGGRTKGASGANGPPRFLDLWFWPPQISFNLSW